jgi:CheY-like chemotaxis protein
LAVPVTTVLVVEDEVMLGLLVSESLADEGFEVLTAANADQAIEILESRDDISTIFTDVEMPGSMDGLKLAKAVSDRWPPVNIVITTGKTRPQTDKMPKKSLFVPKPYHTADVVNAIRAF